MAKEKYQADSFGALLAELIKRHGYTKTRFLQEMGISKTYLFDIFHGRVKAPNVAMQLRMAEVLELDDAERADFFDKAALVRKEVPADIFMALAEDASLRAWIRTAIANQKEG